MRMLCCYEHCGRRVEEVRQINCVKMWKQDKDPHVDPPSEIRVFIHRFFDGVEFECLAKDEENEYGFEEYMDNETIEGKYMYDPEIDGEADACMNNYNFVVNKAATLGWFDINDFYGVDWYNI